MVARVERGALAVALCGSAAANGADDESADQLVGLVPDVAGDGLGFEADAQARVRLLREPALSSGIGNISSSMNLVLDRIACCG